MTSASTPPQPAQLACELLRIHELLLRDAVRNRAFRRALELHVTPGSTVLDIGAGTGIWAITAAQLGARKVVAIEMISLLVGLIRALARDHGVADRVTVIEGDSRQLQLPREFDVVISETIGHVIFDEQIVEIMINARERFLKPGGALIPDSVTLMAAGAKLDEAANLPAAIPGQFARFESLLRHAPIPLNDKKPLQLRTSPASLVHVDLKSADAEPPLTDLTARWPQQEVAEINCFAVWAEVTLNSEVHLSTMDTPSWSATAYRISPFAQKSGDLEFRLSLSAHTNHWTGLLRTDAEQETQTYSPEIAAAELRRLNVVDSVITLRPVTSDDLDFVKRVYASTRERELSLVPWPAEQKAAFLEMQFAAQDRDYHANYPDAAFDVILLDGAPIGRLYVDRRRDEVSIIDIALLPEHRGLGIGGRLLADLIAESEAAGKPLEIYVEKYNRAQILYRRLGFVEAGDAGVYWRMVRPVSRM